MNRFKHCAPYLLMAALLVALDQAVKYWVRLNIPLGSGRPFLPGLVELTYVENTGAAFSLLAEHTEILTIISGLAALLLVFLLIRGIFPHVMGRLSLGLVLGGAVGNLVDRALFGCVVDMFNPTFMKFAVFNVADIGVSCGGVLLCIYVVFFWQRKKMQPDSGKGEETP